MENIPHAAIRPACLTGSALSLLATGFSLCIAAASPASAQVTYNVLYKFTNQGGSGANPAAALLVDQTGPSGSLRALYGTSDNGVFELTPPKAEHKAWKEEVLWTPSFQDGYGLAQAGLTALTKRITTKTTLYSTAASGGKTNPFCTYAADHSCGTAFSVTGHNSAVLWFFTGGSDGGEPNFGAVADRTGALYISTFVGGGSSSCGTIDKLTPPGQGQTAWSETTIWNFTGGPDGCGPTGLIMDKSGAIYGTAYAGGSTACSGGCGSVFELIPPAGGQTAWTEQTLWDFQGGNDGSYPDAALSPKVGELYGTTYMGGGTGNGTVFRLTPPRKGQTAWKERVLWSFTGGADGAAPAAPVIMDASGALYGTAGLGGARSNGTVFKLSPPPHGKTAWSEATLWAFPDTNDGANPFAALTPDNAGVLYGTTYEGNPQGLGVVFSLAGTGFMP